MKRSWISTKRIWISMSRWLLFIVVLSARPERANSVAAIIKSTAPRLLTYTVIVILRGTSKKDTRTKDVLNTSWFYHNISALPQSSVCGWQRLIYWERHMERQTTKQDERYTLRVFGNKQMKDAQENWTITFRCPINNKDLNSLQKDLVYVHWSIPCSENWT